MSTSDSTMQLKRCSRGDNCVHPESRDGWLALDQFSRDKSRKDGLCSQCKRCVLARVHKHYIQNRKHKLQYAEIYRYKNKEKINQSAAQYREKHRHALRDKQRFRALANPKTHQERKRKEYQRNKHGYRVRAHNRRARIRGASGKHNAKDINRQFEVQAAVCYWCQCSIASAYHIDHIIPLSRGGTNFPNNIALTCSACNLAKADKLPYTEWQPSNPLFPPK